MKLAKMIGLGVVAAIASMALVGAVPAMGESTALCKVDQEPCQAGNLTTEVHYVASKILIKTSIMDYECDALFTATVLGLGAPQVLDATSLVYSSCNQGCTRTVIKLGTFSVLRTKAESASIAGNGFEVLVKCGSTLHCIYSFKELTGTVSGPLLTGDNGHVTFTEATLGKVGGFLCPTEARLNALFVPLSAAYVKS